VDTGSATVIFGLGLVLVEVNAAGDVYQCEYLS
jgi:hypothetical protein